MPMWRLIFTRSLKRCNRWSMTRLFSKSPEPKPPLTSKIMHKVSKIKLRLRKIRMRGKMKKRKKKNRVGKIVVKIIKARLLI